MDILGLDHRYLTICYALANNDKQPFQETTLPAAWSVFRDGSADDDDGDQDDDASVQDISPKKTQPTLAVAGKKRSQDDNFLTWLQTVTRSHSVAWNDLGFADDVAPDRKNFVPACAPTDA